MSDTYDEGIVAAHAGLECWANPYAGPLGSKDKFLRWFAGWCFGKQVKEANQ